MNSSTTQGGAGDAIVYFKICRLDEFLFVSSLNFLFSLCCSGCKQQSILNFVSGLLPQLHKDTFTAWRECQLFISL